LLVLLSLRPTALNVVSKVKSEAIPIGL
jgi:hypothetical protein